MSDPYLFVHIPKTAGTSFRSAFEECFPDRVAFDYGPKALKTSEFVRRHVHQHPDGERLRAELASGGYQMLAGHFDYSTYRDLFPAERALSLLRHPVQRVVSEYLHNRRHLGFEGSLREFARRPERQNKQRHMLAGASVEEFAWVGITERYDLSLQLLRSMVGWQLPHLQANRRPREDLPEDWSPELERELTRLNAADLELYYTASCWLDVRAAAVGLSPPLGEAGALRGRLGGYRNGGIFGWAAQQGRERPLLVRIEIEERTTYALASRPRPQLARTAPRRGHVGYGCAVGKLPPKTVVRAFVAGTDHELAGSPLVVE